MRGHTSRRWCGGSALCVLAVRGGLAARGVLLNYDDIIIIAWTYGTRNGMKRNFRNFAFSGVVT